MLGRAEIIQQIVNTIGARTYLEIGVHHAETLLQVRAADKIGIDPEKPSRFIVQIAAQAMTAKLNEPNGRYCLDVGVTGRDTSLHINNRNGDPNMPAERLRYFQMTSDDFFAQEADSVIGTTGVDVAFVDGLHEWRQAVRDIENCLRYLNDGGVIVMHDCCPTKEIYATPVDRLEKAKLKPEWDGTWTGDVYRAALWLRSHRDDLELCVLDTDWGVGLLRRGAPVEMLVFDDATVAGYSFTDFHADRKRLLNLQPPEYLETYLRELSEVSRPDLDGELSTNRLARILDSVPAARN